MAEAAVGTAEVGAAGAGPGMAKALWVDGRQAGLAFFSWIGGPLMVANFLFHQVRLIFKQNK